VCAPPYAPQFRYRDLEEMMQERGIQVDHTTISRWVQKYAPLLEKRYRPHLGGANDSWWVDETDVKIKKAWMYFYRTIDFQGNTLDSCEALLTMQKKRFAASARLFVLLTR
jgi:transposase-like protein